MIGGLWYGARTWRTPLEKRLLILLGPARPGRGAAALRAVDRRDGRLLVPTGLGARAARDDRVRPRRPAGARRDATTEAYSWQIVATVMGAAAGSIVAGLLAEHASVEWALATAGSHARSASLVALARPALAAAAPCRAPES